MTDQRSKGKRNLIILNWMGLACQSVGVISMFAAIVGLVDISPQGGFMFLVFGMALGGWAGNLQEIVGLKYRVADLEARGTQGPTDAP